MKRIAAWSVSSKGAALPALLIAVLALVTAAAAHAQGTKADYERAAGLPSRFRSTVFRDRITPHWLDGDRFWYEVQAPGGKRETWLVDARTGAKSPYTPGAAPAAPAGEGLAARAPAGLRSRDNGAETEVTFQNRTSAPVRLFWVDADGERKEYATVPAGGEHRQHTFAGHAWLVTTADGAPLAGFVAEAAPAKAVITGAARASNALPPATGRPGRSTRSTRSPDGKWLALAREHNLVLKDLKSEEEHPLTQDGSAEDSYSERDLWWSPDSRKLAVLRTKRGQEHKVYLVESSPKDQVQPKLHTLDYLKPGDVISQPKPHLFEVESRRELPIPDALFSNPWSITELRWEPDSRRFTFLYNQRGHQVLRIVAVDAATGEARPIVDEQGKTFIDYAGKYYSYYLPESGELLWMSERDGWNHLYLYDTATGRVKNQVTRGEWVVRGVDRVDPQRRQVWFRAGGIDPTQDPYYLHYCRVNFDGTGLVRLTEGDGTHTVQFSPDSRYLIDTWSRVDQPPVTELRSAETGKRICELERADASALTSAGWRAPERFTAKSRDGKTEIYGLVFRPTNFDPAKRYPVIEDIYAGPQGSFVPKEFRPYHSQQGLAELGFIVVKIDGMGTSNRSKAFHDVCWKNLGDAGLPDRILWMQAAAAKYPEMDLTRVGIFGGSAGGQNALRALLAHPEFYKVGVSGCGCHDNRMDKIWWNELWMGWPVGPHYDEQSNVTQAHRLQGKLLLIVGELDNNVDPASTMQVVDRLVKANKDFDLLVVPGAGHGMGGAYGMRRLQDFFVRHLLGLEPRR
jgi:dipeptidyl-peptidase-4